MTNEEFAEWRQRHFNSQMEAAAYLELDRDTVKALETGVTKTGGPYPVRRHIALACLAIDKKLVKIGRKEAPRKPAVEGPPAPGRRDPEQTARIIQLADGTLSADEIAEKLGINRKAVYAAVAAMQRKGVGASLRKR